MTSCDVITPRVAFLGGCSSGSNGPILIPFAANCSWIILELLYEIKSILKMFGEFSENVPLRRQNSKLCMIPCIV